MMKILNVEDAPRDSALIERELQLRFGAVELVRVDTLEGFNAALAMPGWDLIIADHKLPSFSSLGALAALQASGKDIPVIVVSGTMGLEFAVESMRAGARDYLVKSDLRRLGAVVEREVQDVTSRRLVRARQVVAGEVLETLNVHGDLAPQLGSVLEMLRRHAGADAAAIRLRVKDDFPYFTQVGFSAPHVASESPLCVPGQGGEAGGPERGPGALACLCGAVLRQSHEVAGMLTDRGAFVSGSIDLTFGQSRQGGRLLQVRGRCAEEGYQSMALIPLRDGAEVIGLLQFSARAPDRFGPDLVRFLEEVAPSLGLAVERRRAEEGLRLSEERYRVLVETSSNGVALASLDGTILKANRRLASLLGVGDAASLEGLRLTNLVAIEDRGRAEAELARFMEPVSPHESLLRIHHGTAEFDAEVTGAATSIDPSTAELVVTLRDVTEQRRLRAQLAQSERMASVGMLAAGVAHEINNPLTYVLANLEGLSADLPAVEVGLPPATEPLELVQRAQDAFDGAKRIRAIVRDLNIFSRIADQRVEPVSVNRVIEGALNMTQNEWKYRARVVVDYGAVPPVLANEGKLAQVFLNLLVNAAQAIGDGDVERNQIHVRTWTEAGTVLAEVRDTGIGIPEGLQARVFEPLFTTKPPGIGTGLGLAISRGIVEEAGGRISLESKPGEGAKFVVRLPAASADLGRAPPVATAPPHRPGARRGRVLVVEDEPLIRVALARMLASDHDVVEAESGAVAERLLAADGRFDVILSDLIMPDVSGMDLHDGLALTRPELAARMVFMTGGAFTQRARAFLEAVPNLRIEKPFDAVNLRELVHLLVAGRTQA